jgi:hypothetical protein
MSYPINYPTPQNCNVQFFYGSPRRTGVGGTNITFTWVKPKGASFVWFTLIGGGGSGGTNDGSNFTGGGGSGSVTNCLMPAFLVPDQLRVNFALNGVLTVIYQRQNVATGYTILQAGVGGDGNTTAPATGGSTGSRFPFTVAGLYQSTAGQPGVYGAPTLPSPTTFLSAGASWIYSTQPNYGYPSGILAASAAAQGGYSQVSPIIVGVGGAGISSTGLGTPGGLGSGGGGSSAGSTNPSGGNGGHPMVVIISW